jgi:hypothetical protein
MAGVAAEISLHISAKETGTGDLGTPAMLAKIEKLLSFTPGTAADGQANILFSDERTLAASATEDLDLAGALTSAIGTAIAAAEIVFIYVEAASGNTNDVQVTRPAANGVPIFMAAGDGVALKPGDFFCLSNDDGYTVTAATGDLLTFTNSAAGTAVTYKVLIIARTAAS